MKIAFILLGLLLVSLGARAQSIKDPIQDYLTSHDIDKDIDLPSLQELYVLKYDLDGSGKQSVLISFNGYGGRQGNFWTAYIPSGKGYLKVEDDNVDLMFLKNVFFIGKVGKRYGLLAYHPGKGGGDMILYQFKKHKVTEEKIASVSYDSPELEHYFGSDPNWKAPRDFPIETVTNAELEKDGYDPKQAIHQAEASNHPLNPPIPSGATSP